MLIALSASALNMVLASQLGAEQLFTVNSGSILTVSGKLSGTGGAQLTKEGAGELILSNDNSGFTGSVELDNNAMRTAERTLRMWKLTDQEIKEIRAEADVIREQKLTPEMMAGRFFPIVPIGGPPSALEQDDFRWNHLKSESCSRIKSLEPDSAFASVPCKAIGL